MFRTALTTLLLAAAMPALADTHISFVDDSGQPATQLYIKGGKVRFDNGHGFAVYDVASNSMTMVMPEQQKYLVLNQQAAAQIGAESQAVQQQAQAGAAQTQAAMAAHQGQVDQAQAQMQAAMAKMSPQMQAQMQKMMGNQMGPGGMNPMANMGPPQIEMKDLGTSETVAGHNCQDEQMVVNGRPGATMCVAPPDSLGIPGGDLATLKAMKDGMQKLMAQMGPMAQGMTSMMSKGFAIKSQHQSFDRATMKMATTTDTLKSISTGGVSSDLFQIPAGYTQTSMDQMMGGMSPHH